MDATKLHTNIQLDMIFNTTIHNTEIRIPKDMYVVKHALLTKYKENLLDLLANNYCIQINDMYNTFSALKTKSFTNERKQKIQLSILTKLCLQRDNTEMLYNHIIDLIALNQQLCNIEYSVESTIEYEFDISVD